MFSFTDHDADDTVLSAPLDGVAEEMAYTDGVRDMLRLSRQSEARAVLGAGMIGDRAYNDRMNGQGPHATSRSHTKAHKHAIGEISLQLGITRGKAGEWSSLAQMLAHLPKIRLAYLAGDFSTHRVTELAKSSQIAPKGNLRERINEIIDAALGPRPNLGTDDHPDSPDDAVADEALEDPAQAPIDFEDIALELAYRPTPDTVLRDELDSALISLDPDAHAQAREDVAQAFQNVTFAKEAFGHMEMSACLSAEHAIHLQHRIADLLDERVCRRDPRRVGHRRAVALAEIHGVPGAHLQCECGYDTCTAAPSEPIEPTEATGTEPEIALPDSAASTSTAAADAAGANCEPCSDDPSRPTPQDPGDTTRDGYRAECRCPERGGAPHTPDPETRRVGPDITTNLGAAAPGSIASPDTLVIDVFTCPTLTVEHPPTDDRTCRPSATPRVGKIYLYRDFHCRHP
ncbi:hypothetical protein GIY30_07020 [Gordonia sp. HNM0687]|uniref:DUF222 domain-containing protein n=1 Tax=Gordonia mangrovi TaxID=2665643 RepID=A0A6L7GME9_9ACTN|nr:hypothetical protein [Gordonia mangrovi]MXP21104.1 hypothetical protein [Gordonia mangrovi]UVF78358.1 hypothetical protein NWF22_00210 [Gordonia mangrovi]